MNKVSWGFVAAGFGSLLVAAYYDNIRGPLLPLMASDLGLAYAGTGWYLAVSYAAATVATLVLLAALNHFSERRVMVAVAGIAALAAGVGTQVDGIPSLFLLAVLAGAAVSNLGTMSNVLVLEGAPPASAGRYLSGLHAMFGIGSMLATAAVGIGVDGGMHWTSFYAAGAPLILALALFSAWRLSRGPGRPKLQAQSARLAPLQVLCVATFGVYVAAEVTGALWMASFLVADRGHTVAAAAPYVTAYFLVLTLARVTSATFFKPGYEKIVLLASLGLPVLAYALAHGGAAWALPLVGLYGPFFPVFLSVIRRSFPDKWRSTTLWTVVCMNVTIGTVNVGLGRLADTVGIGAAYYLPLVLLVLAFGLVSACLRLLPRPVS